MQKSDKLVEVNTYNLSSGKFGYRDEEMNGNDERHINGELQLNRNYINEPNDQDYAANNEPMQINNPIYYQQPPQAAPQARGGLDDSVFLQQDENRMANKALYGEEHKQENQDESVLRNAPKQELYFSTKIRNTGYWGKVRLRRGTWMVIIGLFFMCISLTIISVFWAFWYHPAVNIPCRVLGITLLVWSVSATVFGLISNWLMINDPLIKYFVGSPVRWTFWLFIGSTIMITIASILITIYYTYWHNRFVNTPMIIIAIHFYFFGGIAFIFAFIYNIKLMLLDIKVAKYGPKALESSSSSEDEDDYYFDPKIKRTLSQHEQKRQLEQKEHDKIDELYAAKSASPYMQTTAVPTTDNSETRHDFRKKVIQMKPRNLLSTSTYQNANNNGTNYSPNQSFTNNSKN